jgi:hypothetical protein
MVNDGFFIIRGGSFNISINKAVKLMNAKKFTVYSIVIAILLLSISEISANLLQNTELFIAPYPYFVLFFLLITVIAFWLGDWGLKKSADSSVFIVLGMVVGKMLLSMIFALIFIYGSSLNKIAFLISFFLPYFIYTAFEIYSLMSNLRALKK